MGTSKKRRQEKRRETAYSRTSIHTHTEKKAATWRDKNAREMRSRDGVERDEKEEGKDPITQHPQQLQRQTEHTDTHRSADDCVRVPVALLQHVRIGGREGGGGCASEARVSLVTGRAGS